MTSEHARRILIDGSMARAGGGVTYLVNLVPRLAALRPDAHFLFWVRNAQVAARLPKLPNLEVELLPQAGWAGQLLFTFFEAPPRARAFGAELYFSTGEYAPLGLPCPTIASFRNPNVFTALEQGWPTSQRLRLNVLRRLAHRSARGCERILFMSEDAASWIGDTVELPPYRRTIVPHGIDTEIWTRAGTAPVELPGGRPYVLSVSTIYRYKNFVRLIEAWARVAERLPDTPDLVILGGNQDPAHHREMERARAANPALAERIHLVGEVSYPEVRDWYAGARLFVFPSYLETFGHPLLEALAMEVPVIAANIAVFREIGGDATLYVDQFDVGALADAMETVLTSPQLEADLAKRGRERALEFSWDRSARGTLEMFDEVLAARRAPVIPVSVDPNGRLPIGILVIARDEETNLPDAIHSAIGWAEQVVIVLDPRTTDRSREVAEAAGAEVVEHLFETYARQRNWALDHVAWRTPWILVLDADERVSPELVDELRGIVTSPSPCAGLALKKRFIFYGAWMKHCWYSSWDLRFFQHGRARYEDRQVHEHMIVDGPVGFLTADLIHNDFKDMDSWIVKHNRYATFEATEIVAEERDRQLRGRLFGTPIERRRFLKERVWNRFPFRPLFLFLYLYVWKLGILDGRLGLRFCVMHAVFDAFVMAKVWEHRFVAAGGVPNYYRRELASYLARNPEAGARYPAADAE